MCWYLDNTSFGSRGALLLVAVGSSATAPREKCCRPDWHPVNQGSRRRCHPREITRNAGRSQTQSQDPAKSFGTVRNKTWCFDRRQGLVVKCNTVWIMYGKCDVSVIVWIWFDCVINVNQQNLFTMVGITWLWTSPAITPPIPTVWRLQNQMEIAMFPWCAVKLWHNRKNCRN